MKRKIVSKLLCISLVSAMLVSAPCMAFAYEQGEIWTAVYNGECIEVVIDGDYVILPDDERILLKEFTGQFIGEDGNPVILPQEKAVEGQTSGGETQDETAVPDENPGSGENGGTAEELLQEEGTSGENGGDSGAGEALGGNGGAGQNPGEEGKFPGDISGDAEEDKLPGNAGDISGDAEEGMLPGENEEGQISQEDSEETEDSFAGPPAITAGIGFYVEELAEKYDLTFEEEFKDTVSEIEEEFLAEVRHVPAEKVKKERISRLTKNLLLKEDQTLECEEEDETVFTNWQDVLTIYLLEESRGGADAFVMDASDKEGIAAVFGRMNHGTIVENQVVITAETVEEYKAGRIDLSEDDYAFLEKYTSPNCSLLCAAATGIQGFIVQSLGEGVSRERARVVEAAYGLIGKIPYYYGGKSSAIGWDVRWGEPEFMTAAGTLKTGGSQKYGLDCSGFVTWAFINGYEDERMAGRIGHGTTSQWWSSEPVSEEEALPGDLVFLNGPGATGPNNHVGIVAGRNDDGKLVVIHCNGSDNGVVAESAYSAGFRYVRRPLLFADEASGALFSRS